MHTSNIPIASLYQSMLQLIFETNLHSCSFHFIFFHISYVQIWIFFANLMLGWQIWTFLNTEWTGLLENVRIFNHMQSQTQMISQKQLGHVWGTPCIFTYSCIQRFVKYVKSWFLDQLVFVYVRSFFRYFSRFFTKKVYWLWSMIAKYVKWQLS